MVPGGDRSPQQQRHVLHRRPLLLVGVRVVIGDQFGIAGQQRVQDHQPVPPQRGSGLGQVDDRVHDVRHLGLSRAVRGRHDRLDPIVGQESPGQRGKLGRDPDPVRQIIKGGPARGDRHREHHPDRIRSRLGVSKLAERGDVGTGLSDPVPPGNAEVEQPLRYVQRDLLRPQEPHPVDPRVLDRGVVRAF